MSKHDTIERNLMALTRTASFKQAVQGWTVLRQVALSARKWQACELCGTQCHYGAMVRHPRAKATIFVGGTCLETLLRHRFAPSFNQTAAAAAFTAALGRRYGEALDPHNWLTWVIENAPKALQEVATELKVFGAAASRKELAKLIDFHDRRRLFHCDTLLGNAAILSRLLGKKVPTELTIFQARKLLKNQDAPTLLAEADAERFRRREIVPTLKDIPAMDTTWRALSEAEQAAVAGLARLSSDLEERTGVICDDAEMADWPDVGATPAFVWHSRVGLGFIEGYDLKDAAKANVWLWRPGGYAPSAFVLTYWKGVVGVRAAAARRIQKAAFRRPSPRWLRSGTKVSSL